MLTTRFICTFCWNYNDYLTQFNFQFCLLWDINVKVGETNASHYFSVIWGNKDQNKTHLPFLSVLGHVHSIALSKLMVISPSFVITRSRWPFASRLFVSLTEMRKIQRNPHVQPDKKVYNSFVATHYFRHQNFSALTAFASLFRNKKKCTYWRTCLVKHFSFFKHIHV